MGSVVGFWLEETGVKQMETMELRKERDHSGFTVGTASHQQ
jgi:hypothetical protein